MPKLKTHKGLRQRVRVTKNGKVVRSRAGKSHLMSSMSGKKVRQLRCKALVSAAESKAIRGCLPK